MSFIAACLLMIAAPIHSPADSLLVEVTLTNTQERIVVEAVLLPDSTLLLTAEPIYRLLGIGMPASQWTTMNELQRAYPSVAFIWAPQEMRVVIVDRMEALPASRRAKAEIVARSQASFSLPVESAPFMSLAVDDSLHKLLEAGYNWRGRVAVAGRVDDARSGSWGATVAPNSLVFLTYQGVTNHAGIISGRVAAGPVWVSSSYTPHSPVDVSALVRVKDVSMYSSKQYGVLTWQGSPWTAQVARNWKTGQTATRISVGPAYASPFAFPQTTLAR